MYSTNVHVKLATGIAGGEQVDGQPWLISNFNTDKTARHDHTCAIHSLRQHVDVFVPNFYCRVLAPGKCDFLAAARVEKQCVVCPTPCVARVPHWS